jgi:hypothetical protein
MTVPLLNNIMANRRESGINNILLTNNNSKPSNNNRTVDVQYVFNENEKQKLLNKHIINKNKIISYSPVPMVPPSGGGGGGGGGDVNFGFDADWIMVTYEFTDGQDLDTRSRIVAPDIGQVTQPDMIGWGYPVNEWPQNDANPIINWAGDNLGIGLESVLIDINRLKTLYPSSDVMVADFRAFWYNQVGIEPVFGAFTLWKGGVPVLQPLTYTWTNPTATDEKEVDSASLVIPPGIPDGVGKASTTGYRLATLTYNLQTNIGILNNADTTTPNVPTS